MLKQQGIGDETESAIKKTIDVISQKIDILEMEK